MLVVKIVVHKMSRVEMSEFFEFLVHDTRYDYISRRFLLKLKLCRKYIYCLFRFVVRTRVCVCVCKFEYLLCTLMNGTHESLRK